MLSEIVHSNQSPVSQYYKEMEIYDEGLVYSSKQ